MNEKRKDSKGRLLKTGEIQCKDGSYEYKYKDLDGERRSLYNWRIVTTDKTPAGKENNAALREQEEQIGEKLKRGYNIWKANVTLSECIENI